MSKIEVMTGPERRRRWNDEQKLQIVAGAFSPGATVSDAARRAGVCTGQIYRWRKELGAPAQAFSRALVAEPSDGDRLERSPIEIDFNDIRVRISASAPLELVACVINGLTRP
jgi:transposase